MIGRQSVLRLLLLFFVFSAQLRAAGQPTLPEIAGTADKGAVTLSWVCQYEGVKSIAVMRSADSTKISKNIGNLKQPAKGVHTFTDEQPEAGKNFYKVILMFKSGLTWSSNATSVYVDRATLPVRTNAGVSGIDDHGNENKVKEAPAVQQVATDTVKHPKVVINYDIDSNTVNTEARAAVAATQRKITVTYDDPLTSEATFIKYRFVSIDPLNGHVDMNLPDDISTHHYSIKFYNERAHVVMEVPKITQRNIIFDRRNFQKKGVYKFVIRRDVVELESGYIVINK